MTADSLDDSLPPLDVTRFRDGYPSESVVSQVHHLLQDAEKMISECGADPSTKARTRRINRRIQAYRAYISPNRRVPVEIWTQIFQTSISPLSSPGLTVNEDGILLTPTLNLTHVCATWRAVVISMPGLWSNLDLVLENDPETDSRLANTVPIYLQRSQTSPLRFKLNAVREPGDDDDDDDEVEIGPAGWGVFKRLLEVSDRWLAVELNMAWSIANHSNLGNILKAFQDNQCNILQSLSIDFGGTHEFDESEESPRLFELFARAPQFKSLRLEEFDPSFALPFSQLRELTVDSIFGEQIMLPFEMCHNLLKLDITVESLEDYHIYSGFFEECMPVLSSLRCSLFSCVSNAHPIFPCLSLPALRHLELSADYSYGVEACQALSYNLKDLILRSSCQLSTLKLAIFGLSDQDIIQILLQTPQLAHLELGALHSRGFTTSLFQHLSLHSNQPGNGLLVLRLTSLLIWIDNRCCQDLEDLLPDPKVILAMVQSRRNPEIEGLTSFGFHVFRHSASAISSRFKDWVSSFSRVAEPGLSALAEGGLELELDLTSECSAVRFNS
ncbi:hypothetical protein D9758_003382 [Tetrapyrgos nigripes]|uniref:F-box domain-containing protein n=1 Tax=Tetrapyrgos nigripes TaxID=182062 RepID=A0A8H5LWC2_9AGAR|nr:hypothetical protein D9758_003382 [Tetrapyrgos nigripes]